jgi:hypothetical protein
MAEEIQSAILLVIEDKKSTRQEGAGWRTVVVQYFKNGENIGVHLVKQNYWVNENDHSERFKLKGFGLSDLQACNPHWKKIADLMRNPPPLPDHLKKKIEEAAAAAAVDIEEVPF